MYLAKAGALAEAVISKGANRFDGISFAVEHPERVVEKLTGEAVKNARALAQTAAQAAGVRLGRVLSITRLGAEPIHAMARVKRVASASPPIEPGMGTVESSMEVTWAIEP